MHHKKQVNWGYMLTSPTFQKQSGELYQYISPPSSPARNDILETTWTEASTSFSEVRAGNGSDESNFPLFFSVLTQHERALVDGEQVLDNQELSGRKTFLPSVQPEAQISCSCECRYKRAWGKDGGGERKQSVQAFLLLL